jgi:ATP-dependent helicase/nuclease subunit A
LWPPHERTTRDEGELGEEAWEDEDKRDFARHLANRIKALIDEAPVLASTGRPLTAGDILVLVRSRASGLANLLVGRLFERGVPIAGLDRLELSEPFAVQDLLAAMRFAVQPLDDLSLANLLVSPLGGWNQDDLYRLARRESGTALWEELGRRRAEEPLFTATRAMLEDLLGQADFVGPYAFLERILSGPMQGRRRLLGRLGKAARDPVNELLGAALTFEGQESGGLQRFLHWFAGGKVEVKRDPEAAGDAVRIMTVHGAKGLEAPVVFLADATSDPTKSGGFSPPLWYKREGGKVPLIRPRKPELCAPFEEMVDEEKAAELREHHRLGYVALTRAAERLVIAGLKPKDKDGRLPDQCWHRVVGEALGTLGAATMADGTVVLERGSVVPIAPPSLESAVEEPTEVPDWARTPAPIEARPPRPLAPSQIAPDTDSRPPPTPELAAAAERGRLLHALFERLPATIPGERRKAAFAWLQHSAGVSDPALRTALVDAALVIIEAREHADLFGPDALAEAPIAATLQDGMVVAGTVDRLLVTPEIVRVVDFKTGRSVPASPDEVPRGHRRQMEAYAEALSVIFPGRRIEAGLLYTSGPRLILLPLEQGREGTHMRDRPNQELLSP